MKLCLTRSICATSFALIGLVCAGIAFGNDPVPIAIANPGFEEDEVSEGCFEVMRLTDWEPYDPDNLLDGGANSIGGINLPVGSVFFPGGAPEGEHASLVFLLTTTGLGPVGLRQELDEVLRPNTRYVLTVQVGDIDSGVGPPPCDVFGEFNLEGFPGYHVQLLAGGEMIAEDNNSLAGVLDDGLFALSTSEGTVGPTQEQLGVELEIRLINLNEAETPENPGIEVDFDDVQLTRECVATGDIDGGGTLDAIDVGIFVDVLVDAETDPVLVGRSDVDCSGTADGGDIARLVGLFLE